MEFTNDSDGLPALQELILRARHYVDNQITKDSRFLSKIERSSHDANWPFGQVQRQRWDRLGHIKNYLSLNIPFCKRKRILHGAA